MEVFFGLLCGVLCKASLYGDWGRALQTIPTAIFVLKSWVGCLKEQWQGRRHFNWVSSINVEAESQLQLLSTRMTRFYGQTETRLAYQSMIDAERSSQPLTEGELRKTILRTKPETVLEVGCGSGRIYERLVQDGMGARYTGVEIANSVISSNRIRFPACILVCWHGRRIASRVRKPRLCVCVLCPRALCLSATVFG